MSFWENFTKVPENIQQNLEINAEKLEGKVVSNPTRESIDYEIKEQLIIEFYSR